MKYLKLASTILLCEAVGLISTPFTIASIPTWYASLTKPFFSPPNWIFAPVWTALYCAMGIALYLVWEKNKKGKAQDALFIFAVQLALNFFWSVLFFGFRSPLFGFIEIVLLWTAIYVTIKRFGAVSKTAAYLLYPYIAWVSFAAVLNGAILILNR